MNESFQDPVVPKHSH